MLEQFEIRTPSHACLIDITDSVTRRVAASGVKEGVCFVFVPHTTAGITINENADPTVRSDIVRQLDKIVPWDDAYQHDEGNAAAHIKASLLGSCQTLFVTGGELKLGTWQGVYLAEFDGPRTRRVWLKILTG